MPEKIKNSIIRFFTGLGGLGEYVIIRENGNITLDLEFSSADLAQAILEDLKPPGSPRTFFALSYEEKLAFLEEMYQSDRKKFLERERLNHERKNQMCNSESPSGKTLDSFIRKTQPSPRLDIG